MKPTEPEWEKDFENKITDRSTDGFWWPNGYLKVDKLKHWIEYILASRDKELEQAWRSAIFYSDLGKGKLDQKIMQNHFHAFTDAQEKK